MFKAVSEKLKKTFRSGGFIIRKLCKGSSERNMSTGTVAPPFLTCLDASKVYCLLSVFTLIETIYPKIEAKVSKNAKRLLWVDVFRSLRNASP